MKAKLTICGVDCGEIEVGEDSFAGLMARGEAGGSLSKLRELQATLEKLGVTSTVTVEAKGASDG